MPTRRAWIGVLALVLLALVARGPLHAVTYSQPVTNDDAIPLLMARHLLRGELVTTLWNQPYNGALDAYLLAPFLLVAGPHAVFRAYEALCAILLVIAAGRLARRVAGPRAGWLAAALCAVGTPYMALMAATGPTPNFLVPLLVGAVLLGVPEDAGQEVGAGRAALLGLVGGLALWDSALALPALCGIAAGLLALGYRPRARTVVAVCAGLAIGMAPLLMARAIGAQGQSTVTALRPRWLWTAGIFDLVHAAAGLLGVQVPLVVDGPERIVPPGVVQALLVLMLMLPAIAGATETAAAPLVLWAGALAGAFALSRRTGGDEIRYLYGLVLPALAILGSGLAHAWERRRAVAAGVAVLIVLPWIWGEWQLARVWRDPQHATRVWEVPPLEPALGTLRRAGVQSAYASLQFAGRLTLDSGGDVIASQAWNERIPGDPLRFRDEVDLDPQAAWVLSPHLSRGMPRAGGLRDLLQGLGGAWHEDAAGDLVVFRAFRPPFDELRPVPRAALTVRTLDDDGVEIGPVVLDRDVETRWTSPTGLDRGRGITVQLTPARRVSALVLVVDLDPTPLAVPWICDADGRVVAHGPARFGLQWLNGAPRAARQAALTIVLPDVSASTLRLVFQGPGPSLGVREVFVYGPDETPVAAAGAPSAAAALSALRRGDWDGAVRGYEDAVRAQPDSASLHACLERARWRAAHRRRVDVESLGDGGEDLLAR